MIGLLDMPDQMVFGVHPMYFRITSSPTSIRVAFADYHSNKLVSGINITDCPAMGCDKRILTRNRAYVGIIDLKEGLSTVGLHMADILREPEKYVEQTVHDLMPENASQRHILYPRKPQQAVEMMRQAQEGFGFISTLCDRVQEDFFDYMLRNNVRSARDESGRPTIFWKIANEYTAVSRLAEDISARCARLGRTVKTIERQFMPVYRSEREQDTDLLK